MKKIKSNAQDSIPELITKLGTVANGSLLWNHYWHLFDHQVAKFLWSVCRNTASISGTFCEEELEDLESVTRHKIYEKLGTFTLPPDSTAKANENKIKKWFVTILKNVYHDMLVLKNKESGIFASLEDFDQDTCSTPPENENKLSPKNQHLLELIHEAAKILSKRDYEIWQTYALNRDSKGRIPEYLLHYLESKYKLKKGYSSKIFDRANNRIKKHIKTNHYEKADSNDTGDDEVSG